MGIHFFSEDVAFPKIGKRFVSDWLKKVIQAEAKKIGDVSIVFCSDEYLLNVNQEYLNHDYYTDIITFDYVEGSLINGDIFISIDRVAENAKEYNVAFEKELYRIIVHGFLHLIGYKDKLKTDKQLMTQKEDFYLEWLDKDR